MTASLAAFTLLPKWARSSRGLERECTQIASAGDRRNGRFARHLTTTGGSGSSSTPSPLPASHPHSRGRDHHHRRGGSSALAPGHGPRNAGDVRLPQHDGCRLSPVRTASLRRFRLHGTRRTRRSARHLSRSRSARAGRRRAFEPHGQSSTPTIGQAPSDVFAMIEPVAPDAGSCQVRADTPASYPSRITSSEVQPRQNPRP